MVTLVSALMTTFFSLFWACWCGLIIISLSFFVFWILMIIDCIQREEPRGFSEGQTKLLWVLLLILAGGVAAFVYYFIIYKKIPRPK